MNSTLLCRASTPMFLMSRKIKSLGVKMVLSGEGSDEIFGGYLYFHKAPNKKEFHEETCRKIKALHLYDCLRANKATSAWGVEARVPFLHKSFINVAMDIDPEWKMIKRDLGRIEKWVILMHSMMRRGPIYLSIFYTGKRNSSVMVLGIVGLMA
uniref:Asparagine synthetase domain-containing protein n=1 Tax=Setaria viridis TaxID=4556 RepID=A0A4U6UWB3_SETVI|nr:hypothetical protein SEVIR_4G118903v2 [Setaria viridis]